MRLIKSIRCNFFTQEIRNFNTKFLEDDYQILGFLGQGSTSRVFLGSNIITNDKVVIKIFKQIPEDKIYREIRVNNKINSYCQKYKMDQFPILKLLDVVRNKGCGSFAFIFQYFPGSPMHMTPTSVIKQKRFQYMQQILNGLRIVHSVNLIHRDLKPSNILVTTDGAKLFDFGLSKQKGVDELKTNRFGTKCYYPPQVVFRIPEYDQRLDIWTCGLIFAELLTLIKPILPYKSDLQTLQQVVNFCQYNQKEDGEVIREDFKGMILSRTHSKSFNATINHLRWTQQILPELNNDKYQTLLRTIKKMLRINPRFRPSATQILQDLKPIFQTYK